MTLRSSSTRQPEGSRGDTRRPAWRLALLYLGLGIGWIVVTDFVVANTWADPAVFLRSQLLKGVFYVTLTAGLLYWLIARELKLRQAAEAEQRLQETRWRLALEASLDGIWERQPATGACFYSDRMYAMLGSSPAPTEEQSPRFFSQRMHPEDAPAFEALFTAVAEGRRREPFEIVVRLRAADRTWRHILIRGAGTDRQKTGKPRLVIGTHTDVTELHQAILRLRESERRLATLLDNLPGMAYRRANDAACTMELVSGFCRELTGYEPAALIGNREISYLELILPEDRASVGQTIDTALAELRPFQLEYRLQTRHDGIRWVAERGRGVFAENGELMALEGFIIDITARKRAEIAEQQLSEELREQQKMDAVGHLAGGIAHDFNNLLTVIIGNVELLQANGADATARNQKLAKIQTAATRAADLTRQLLAFGRKQVLQVRAFELNDWLRQQRPQLRQVLGDDLALNLELSSAPLPMEADPSQLMHVLRSLCLNAREVMGSDGVLRIRTERWTAGSDASPQLHRPTEGTYALIVVADNGPGIPAHLLGRIFEPFFTTKEVGQGSGLGLATVYGIVRQSGGQVQVESEPGKGTTFRIYLPLATSAATGAVIATATEPRHPEKPFVLVVEDNPGVLAMVRETLMGAGLRVAAADSAAAALAYCQREQPALDVLVTDVIMPGRGGIDLADDLRRLYPELPVIFISGYAEPGEIASRAFDGYVKFLPKPFSSEDLLATIQTAATA